MSLLRRVWDALSRGLMAFGHCMSKFVVTPLLYTVIGGLFTGFARRGDPLRVRPPAGTLWQPRRRADDTLERARSLH
ncbi:MAG: hypothetical protein IT204_06195 [Fimbriimonadaceae bacterium]|nr:hypothetical protein [Fimbriimonadaceae bacterium]